MAVTDRARVADFVAENRQALARTAYLLTGDAVLAQDLLQEALVRAIPRWGRIEPGCEFAYLRRVMANLRTDWWRRRRFEVVADMTAPAPVPDARAAVGGGDVTRTAGLEAVEDRDLIVRRLARLTARERAVLVLRYYTDLTEADVAAELGITVGTVKSTCSRALARLAKETLS